MNLNQFSKLVRLVVVCGFFANWVCGAARATDAITNTVSRLVIVKAVYGDLTDSNSTVDVTKQVTGAVTNNAVEMAVNNDNFGDPAEGENKQIKVDYTIDGVAGTKSVYENGKLKISLADKPDATRKAVSSKLVIRKALYGDLPDGDANDVTSVVAGMVKNDALVVQANNDDFGDPAAGTGKKLQVDYTFDGKDKSKTVSEGQTLQISPTGE